MSRPIEGEDEYPVTDIDKDFVTIRESLGELSTYGKHASQHPTEIPAVAAVFRIEARIAELEAALREAIHDMETCIEDTNHDIDSARRALGEEA